MKTITESVLETDQAKEAIGEGLATLILTGDVQYGWDAMIKKGKQNGSYVTMKIAVVLDLIKALRQ